MNKIGFKPIPAAIALGLALLIWFVIPVPDGVTPQAWHLLAMFVGVIAAIIGKAMPIGALSIIAVMLVAVTQVTVPELGADGNPIKKPAEMAVKDALSSFADPLIWLIGISIMISRGILKTGLGAHRLLFYFAVRQENAGHRLQPGLVGADSRAGHAQQHRARRRHHPPRDEGDFVQL